MADVFTQIGSGYGTNLVTLAYDKLIETNLRVLPKFREVADKKVGSLTHNGSSIRFQFNNDIADTTVAGATLAETVDPDSVAIPATSYIDIAQLELGRSVLPVKKINLMSIANIDPWVANAIGFNMTKTLDNAIVAKLDAGANIVRVAGGSGAVSNVYEGVGTVAAKNTIAPAATRTTFEPASNLATIALSSVFVMLKPTALATHGSMFASDIKLIFLTGSTERPSSS